MILMDVLSYFLIHKSHNILRETYGNAKYKKVRGSLFLFLIICEVMDTCEDK